jgi:hypothetical protein
MEPDVRPAGHQPDDHLVTLGDQFLGGHRDVTERGELLGEAVEGRAWFVGLAMDDLVVVRYVRGDVIGQVAEPVFVQGWNRPRMVCLFASVVVTPASVAVTMILLLVHSYDVRLYTYVVR